MSTKTGQWMTLVEYASKNRVSLSTLRRYIKQGKIEHRLQSGRYWVWDPEPQQFSTDLASELLRAKQEIEELKMLVALYESRPPEMEQ
jgi:hypothetical protein